MIQFLFCSYKYEREILKLDFEFRILKLSSIANKVDEFRDI